MMPDEYGLTTDIIELIPDEVRWVNLPGEPQPVAVLSMRGVVMMSLLGSSELAVNFRKWALATLEGILATGSYLPTTALPPEAARLAKCIQDARAAGMGGVAFDE